MVLTATLMVSLAAAAPVELVSPDRSFSIIGFLCDDPVCDDVPRPLRASPILDQANAATLFANLPRHDRNWQVSLNCAVRRDRLEKCRLDHEDDRTGVGTPIALQLTKRLKLIDPDARSPRAIVVVRYEVGDCPSWICTVLPPAPSAPAVGDVR
ncbi:hypothetical protein ACFQ15_00330 [Sphingomonas hankookensis]|uniref:hypothetical protein n=1 Tax=Sphingomonas hankookensis TaxID=563996 RepID=UPI001F5A5829|nr:hypothetical protein [Sphingomonas hankookensis]